MGTVAQAPDLDWFSLPELESAIARSQAFLLREQKPEGYWIGELMVDCTLVADVVAYHHWNGSVHEGWQRKAVNHLFRLQLSGGGWNIYPGGPAEINATIKAYLALKLAGVPMTDPRMLRARQTALSLGGIPRLNTFSKLYLAVLGLFPWEYVPTIPSEVMLIGKWFYVNFNEMSSWSRTVFMCAICCCPATRNASPGAIFSSGWTACINSRSVLPGATSILSANAPSKRRRNG